MRNFPIPPTSAASKQESSRSLLSPPPSLRHIIEESVARAMGTLRRQAQSTPQRQGRILAEQRWRIDTAGVGMRTIESTLTLPWQETPPTVSDARGDAESSQRPLALGAPLFGQSSHAAAMEWLASEILPCRSWGEAPRKEDVFARACAALLQDWILAPPDPTAVSTCVESLLQQHPAYFAASLWHLSHTERVCLATYLGEHPEGAEQWEALCPYLQPEGIRCLGQAIDANPFAHLGAVQLPHQVGLAVASFLLSPTSTHTACSALNILERLRDVASQSEASNSMMFARELLDVALLEIAPPTGSLLGTAIAWEELLISWSEAGHKRPHALRQVLTSALRRTVDPTFAPELEGLILVMPELLGSSADPLTNWTAFIAYLGTMHPSKDPLG